MPAQIVFFQYAPDGFLTPRINPRGVKVVDAALDGLNKRRSVFAWSMRPFRRGKRMHPNPRMESKSPVLGFKRIFKPKSPI
jgi:hypothetical protein